MGVVFMRLDMSLISDTDVLLYGITLSMDYWKNRFGWKAKIVNTETGNENFYSDGDLFVDDMNLLRTIKKQESFLPSPRKLNEKAFLQKFLDVIPNSIVYTGAGLAEKAGIWNLYQLRKNFYLDNKDCFLTMVATRENEILSKVKKFASQLYESKPTSAYYILGELQKRYQFIIATENRDILHQKAGHKVITRDILKRFPLQLMHKQLIVIGLSADHSDFIRLYRTFNKDRPILVIDNGEIPTYCTEADYMCSIDINVFLKNWRR